MKASRIPHQRHESLSSLALRVKLYSMKKKKAYSDYIYKIVKQVPQGTNKYCWALDVLDSLNKPNLYWKVALEASRMSHYNKKHLITSREVHVAACLTNDLLNDS
ncbi:hypothetical protein JRQ81_004916 [Phrynocephalus forsythii]|uniref:Uncharacterized protein n=1 Tax=Phrynocephalus forsythii TaxID=171643 RepID=A0A9Q0XJ35_9SAUR|nr:hypothetical protein JRQ81_004916 [Phrynocephalus forsythii]